MTTSDNKISPVKNYVLLIKGVFIKNADSLIALYREQTTRQIILGIVDMLKCSFHLKQTLPETPSDITRTIFINENLYLIGIQS